MNNNLDKAREIINNVDKEMAELFAKRMEAASVIAEYKKECGLPILDAQREEALIRRNSEYIEDPTLRGFYINFLKSTIEVSRSYQSLLMNGMRVAYSGVEGAFAHIAASRFFPTATKIGYKSFEDAYSAVERGECDVCVLPIENSYNGEVGRVSDLLFSGSLYVNAVTELSVTQDLLGTKDATVESIKQVFSHPQALGQCSEFIRAHGYKECEYENTALAAKYVSEKNDPSIGAIASAEAAELFGLKVISSNINSSATNTTRFIILSRSENPHSSNEMGVHTLLLFTVRNEAGALAKAIDIIGKHGFNMRSLRSRPMKELLWQYYFYVEAEGNINSEEGRAMMKELSQYCDRLKSAGSYTKG